MDGQWCEDDEEENGPGSRCDGHFLAKEQDWRLMSRIISISFPFNIQTISAKTKRLVGTQEAADDG